MTSSASHIQLLLTHLTLVHEHMPVNTPPAQEPRLNKVFLCAVDILKPSIGLGICAMMEKVWTWEPDRTGLGSGPMRGCVNSGLGHDKLQFLQP